MAGFTIIPLDDFLQEYGEDKVKLILSNFSCPLNKDVETFLKVKAIVFEAQGISKTQLIYASFKGRNVLVGYFALANKTIVVTDKNVSGTLRKRLLKFALHNVEMGTYTLSAPLIGQLGKNFANGYHKLITGDELLLLACDTIKEAQKLIGGKFVYLECEDKPQLIDFYAQNGFVIFDKRKLEAHEKTDQCGTYLIQMLKYIQ